MRRCWGFLAASKVEGGFALLDGLNRIGRRRRNNRRSCRERLLADALRDCFRLVHSVFTCWYGWDWRICLISGRSRYLRIRHMALCQHAKTLPYSMRFLSCFSQRPTSSATVILYCRTFERDPQRRRWTSRMRRRIRPLRSSACRNTVVLENSWVDSAMSAKSP